MGEREEEIGYSFG